MLNLGSSACCINCFLNRDCQDAYGLSSSVGTHLCSKMQPFFISPHGPTLVKGLGISSSLDRSGPCHREGHGALEGQAPARPALWLWGQQKWPFLLSSMVSKLSGICLDTRWFSVACASLPACRFSRVQQWPSAIFFSQHQAFHDFLTLSVLSCCLHTPVARRLFQRIKWFLWEICVYELLPQKATHPHSCTKWTWAMRSWFMKLSTTGQGLGVETGAAY